MAGQLSQELLGPLSHTLVDVHTDVDLGEEGMGGRERELEERGGR